MGFELLTPNEYDELISISRILEFKVEGLFCNAIQLIEWGTCAECTPVGTAEFLKS